MVFKTARSAFCKFDDRYGVHERCDSFCVIIGKVDFRLSLSPSRCRFTAGAVTTRGSLEHCAIINNQYTFAAAGSICYMVLCLI